MKTIFYFAVLVGSGCEEIGIIDYFAKAFVAVAANIARFKLPFATFGDSNHKHATFLDAATVVVARSADAVPWSILEGAYLTESPIYFAIGYTELLGCRVECGFEVFVEENQAAVGIDSGKSLPGL